MPGWPIPPFHFILFLLLLPISSCSIRPSPHRRLLPPVRYNLPLKMPPRVPSRFLPMPTAQPQIQLLVLATISEWPRPTESGSGRVRQNLSIPKESGQSAKVAQNLSIQRENGGPSNSKLMRRRHSHSALPFGLEQLNISLMAQQKAEEDEARENWTKLLLKELLLPPVEEQEEELLQVWQLLSLGSGGFVRLRGGKVDARKGGNGEECDTLFLPETAEQGDWTFRGKLLLKHARTGRYLCLGKRRGIVTKPNPGRSALCRFQEHLTASGHFQLLSVRPLGFFPSGRPLTRPFPRRPSRLFQFAKLVSHVPRERAQHCGGRPRRTRAGQEEQQVDLRQIARKSLLEKIEATEEWGKEAEEGTEIGGGLEGEEGSGTTTTGLEGKQ